MKIVIKVLLVNFIWVFLSLAHASESQPSAASEPPMANVAQMPMVNSTDTQTDDLPKTDMTGFSRGTVARSIFTTLIDNREPVDKIKQVPGNSSDVFYFTELRDMAGQTAKHRWEFKGKVIAEVKFKVRGPRWRVWSKKSFIPGWSGDWKVSVLNGADEVISEEVIAFNKPSSDIIENEDTSSAGMSDSIDKNMSGNKMLNQTGMDKTAAQPEMN